MDAQILHDAWSGFRLVICSASGVPGIYRVVAPDPEHGGYWLEKMMDGRIQSHSSQITDLESIPFVQNENERDVEAYKATLEGLPEISLPELLCLVREITNVYDGVDSITDIMSVLIKSKGEEKMVDILVAKQKLEDGFISRILMVEPTQNFPTQEEMSDVRLN